MEVRGISIEKLLILMCLVIPIGAIIWAVIGGMGFAIVELIFGKIIGWDLQNNRPWE